MKTIREYVVRKRAMTLDELRAFVANLDDLPGTTPVRAWASAGRQLRGLEVVEEEQTDELAERRRHG